MTDPIPVAERLPGPDDMQDGRCWWFLPECNSEYAHWIAAPEPFDQPTHWLPFYALPLPQESPNA